MELDIKKGNLQAYESTGEICVLREETAETIVPDYCPDIARIVSCEGKAFLQNRELREGRAMVSGAVRVTVLYTPENGGGLKSLEFSMPFQAESDSKGLAGCSSFLARVEIAALETRMLNPRKIFTHCRLNLYVCGFRPAMLNFGEDLESEPALGMEKRYEEQTVNLVTAVAEKDFMFSDTVTLSAGREGAAELLGSRLSWQVTEAKLLGNKLIFKGFLFLHLLYRTADGECTSCQSELPFSQIMEMEQASEEAQVTVELQMTGVDIQIDGSDEEGRDITLTLYYHAMAVAREQSKIMLLNDLYSTLYPCSYDAEQIFVCPYYEKLQRRQSTRELLEIGVAAEQLLDLSATCGSISVSREGTGAALRTAVTIRALYLDEGGACLAAERCVEVLCRLDLPSDCNISAKAICAEDLQGSLTDRGIEVRMSVDFFAEVTCNMRKISITAVRLDTEQPKEHGSAPSLVLRCLRRQETAWDVAKQYGTTIRAILEANQLEEEGEIPLEKLLLIPNNRV